MTAVSELTVAGMNVSRGTFSALQRFEGLVRRWNPAINLISKTSVAEIWDRHIVDSAQLFAFCPAGANSWVDLGSGGGFPGLVVAILADELLPSLRVTLVESDLRKATFLRQAAQQLSLNVAVISERIESLSPLQADVLSARALTALPGLIGFADTHLRNGGIAIFAKGARYGDELAKSRDLWNFDVEVRPSLSDAEAAILLIREVHRAKD